MLEGMHRPKSSLSVLVLAMFACPMVSWAATSDDFDGVVGPFVVKHCAKCHGLKPEDSTLTLVGRRAADVAKDAEAWRSVLDRLRKNEMPPEGSPRPDAAESRRAVAMLTKTLGESAKSPIVGPLPSDGNKVDHDLLFNAPTMAPLDNPPRYWRLNTMQYYRWADEITRAGRTCGIRRAASPSRFRCSTTSAFVTMHSCFRSTSRRRTS